jgi:hypothetical protein
LCCMGADVGSGCRKEAVRKSVTRSLTLRLGSGCLGLGTEPWSLQKA